MPTVILLEIDYTLLAGAKNACRFTITPGCTMAKAEACTAARDTNLKL